MKKKAVLLSSITFLAAAVVAVATLSLYGSRNQVNIREYDLYGDPAAAEGLTYTTVIGDNNQNFSCGITNTIGGKTDVEFCIPAVDSPAVDENWYYFDIVYGFQPVSTEDGLQNIYSSYEDPLPDYIETIIEDCSNETVSGSSGEFRINLQDYVDTMPYYFQYQGTEFCEYFLFPENAEDSIYEDSRYEAVKKQFSIPLLDPYYINVHLEKDESGELTSVSMEADENDVFPYGVSGEALEDGNSFVFYYAPLSSANASRENWKNTMDYVSGKDICGLYRADLVYSNYEKYEDGSTSYDFDGVELTRLGDLPQNTKQIEAYSEGENPGYVLMLLQSENGLILQSANGNGIIDSLEIAMDSDFTSASEEDLYLIRCRDREDGISYAALSDGSMIVYQDDGKGQLDCLLTSKFMTEEEEMEILKAGLPGYSDHVIYSQSGILTMTAEASEAESTDETLPFITWDGTFSFAYKDGKIAFVNSEASSTGTEANPGSTFITVYDKDGLVYAGYFRAMYTTYISRDYITGSDEAGMFYSDHAVTVNTRENIALSW